MSRILTFCLCLLGCALSAHAQTYDQMRAHLVREEGYRQKSVSYGMSAAGSRVYHGTMNHNDIHDYYVKTYPVLKERLKTDQAVGIVLAHERGYRVINGAVVSPAGKTLSCAAHKGYSYFTLYMRLNGPDQPRKTIMVYAHRLLGYQKYGERLFEPKMVLRHLDGNPGNNLDDNVVIGTQKDNIHDISIETRTEISHKGGRKTRLFTDAEWEIISAEYHALPKQVDGQCRDTILAAKYGCGRDTIGSLIRKGGYKTRL